MSPSGPPVTLCLIPPLPRRLHDRPVGRDRVGHGRRSGGDGGRRPPPHMGAVGGGARSHRRLRPCPADGHLVSRLALCGAADVHAAAVRRTAITASSTVVSAAVHGGAE